MKQPKKLTRNQKEFLRKKGYDWEDYMFSLETSENITFFNKKTGEMMVLEKTR